MIEEIFGSSKDLTILQMSARAILVFIITLVMIRIAGRRSFGMKSAFDNIIVILLGAVLSRAVVGVSPFIPTICACFVIVIMHRIFALASLFNPRLQKILKGDEIELFAKGKKNNKNMRRALVSEKDFEEGLRVNGNVGNLDKVEKVFMENGGEISVVKKEG